jgi:aminopeptidase N
MTSSDPDRILDVLSYDLALDLTRGPETFWSRTEVSFRCRKPGAATVADLHAVRIERAMLNGADLDPAATFRDGRLDLPTLANENLLAVEAEFAYASGPDGLHHVTDARDGSAFVYSKASAQGAPRIFCCFDRHDLRAPFTLSVNAPAGWSCLANAPAVSRPPAGEPGIWRFAPTAPIPPWLSRLCAGSLSGSALTVGRDGAPPLPVTVQAVPSVAAFGEPGLITDLLRQALHFYESTLQVPYPYGKCDLVFGPISPALAYSVPGLILIQDQVLEPSPQASSALYLATVVAHELAHAWFGSLVTMPRDQMWLDEALATYISRTALAEIFPGTTPWAASMSAALPDDYYARDAAAIRDLENLIGQPAVIDGLSTLLHHHAHGQATQDDLVRYWSQASQHDLREWAAESLVPAERDDDEVTTSEFR